MTDEKSSPSESTAGRGWIWTIFVVALLVRGGTLVELSRVDPYWSTPVVDELTNLQDAVRIASGGRQEQPFWKPPLYPHLIALTLLPDPPPSSALYSERAPSPWIPKGFQAILDSFTAVLLVLLGTRLAGPRAGRLAGALYAVSFTPVYYCAQLLDTTVFVFACVAMLWTLDRAREKDDLIGWVLGGIGIGLATATRAPALLFLPIAMVLPWLSRRTQLERPEGPASIGQCALAAVAIAFGTAIAIMPVTLANWKLGGDRVLISSNGGINFYIGNRAGGEPGADGLTSVHAGPRWRALLEEVDQELKPSERSREYYRLTFDQISADPGHFVKRLGTKALALFDAYEIPNNKNFVEERERSLLLRLLPGRTAIVFALGVVGLLFVGARLRHRTLIAGFVLTQAAGIVLFFVAARYRVPILAALTIPAALYLETLFRERRRLGHWVPSLALLVAILAVSHWDFLDLNARFRNYVVDPLALAHAREHLAETARGRAQTATSVADAKALRAAAEIHDERSQYYYELALAMDPDYPEVEHNLAIRALNDGNLVEAERRVRRALDSSGEWFEEGWNTLGQILLAKPQPDPNAAEAAFHQAIEIDPTYAKAYANLGQLYELLQRAGDARAQYELARGYAPGEVLYLLFEVRALVKIGQVRTARALFDRIGSESIPVPPSRTELFGDIEAKLTDAERQQTEQLTPPDQLPKAGPDQ